MSKRQGTSSLPLTAVEFAFNVLDDRDVSQMIDALKAQYSILASANVTCDAVRNDEGLELRFSFQGTPWMLERDVFRLTFDRWYKDAKGMIEDMVQRQGLRADFRGVGASFAEDSSVADDLGHIFNLDL